MEVTYFCCCKILWCHHCHYWLICIKYEKLVCNLNNKTLTRKMVFFIDTHIFNKKAFQQNAKCPLSHSSCFIVNKVSTCPKGDPCTGSVQRTPLWIDRKTNTTESITYAIPLAYGDPTFLPAATKLWLRLCFYTCLWFCSRGGGSPGRENPPSPDMESPPGHGEPPPPPTWRAPPDMENPPPLTWRAPPDRENPPRQGEPHPPTPEDRESPPGQGEPPGHGEHPSQTRRTPPDRENPSDMESPLPLDRENPPPPRHGEAPLDMENPPGQGETHPPRTGRAPPGHGEPSPDRENPTSPPPSPQDVRVYFSLLSEISASSMR